jgi:hypothetical protein
MAHPKPENIIPGKIAFRAAKTPSKVDLLIGNAPELPDVEEALAQTRQLVLRSFSPKPFGGALATAPFGLAAPRPGSIGQRRKLIPV